MAKWPPKDIRTLIRILEAQWKPSLIAPPTIRFVGAAQQPAFTGTWKNLDNNATTPGGGTNRDAGFYVDRGRVFLTGVVFAGASATSAFTLPFGFVPKAAVDRIVKASGGFAIISVAASGTVTITDGPASAVATFVWLDGVDFQLK